MDLLALILEKKSHLSRMANEAGAAGEALAIASTGHWIARPKGAVLKLLLEELAQTGVVIKASSFDAISVPDTVDLANPESVRANLAQMVFIEIKTANQSRVRPGFGGFFFALTENEIAAADQLGTRHQVALFNKATGEVMMTSVPEILKRSRSMTWQLSVQL